MKVATNFSPVLLGYIAALRGVKPYSPGEAFSYAVVNCTAPEFLIGLAASNPEGQFYGFVVNQDLLTKAVHEAKEREVSNVHFLEGNPETLVARMAHDKSFLPPLDFLMIDEVETPLPVASRQAFFELATLAVKPSGLVSASYRVRHHRDDVLAFLVREMTSNAAPDQTFDLLVDIKKLGRLFFQENRDLAVKLDVAIARNKPEEFLNLFADKEKKSDVFDTLVAFGSRGFAYAGDGLLSSNYVELSVPVEAQGIVIKMRRHPLYEVIKDFVLNRSVRHDIWCRMPVVTSDNPAELYGRFAYGILLPKEQVPTELTMQGKTINLSAPVYTAVVNLLTLMPCGIGDLLSHPDCANIQVTELVEAVQVLVACGIARPMRGIRNHEAEKVDSIAQPRLVGGFNRYLDKTAITSSSLLLASPILGDVVSVSGREALVMQALDRAGLANSSHALFQELKKMAQTPVVLARVVDATEPTADMARQMVEEAITQSIIHWYAYGLLEAA